MISDLNRSLRARYFVSVLNERTSFASRARAFEGARLLNCFECASDAVVNVATVEIRFGTVILIEKLVLFKIFLFMCFQARKQLHHLRELHIFYPDQQTHILSGLSPMLTPLFYTNLAIFYEFNFLCI